MAEYMNNMPDAALDWDSEVTNEQREFVLLPAGDYLFTVQSFERARYEGSAKLPPCSMAKLTITIHGGDKGETTVTHRLYLHTKTQGLLGAFLRASASASAARRSAPAGTKLSVRRACAAWACGNTPSRAAPTPARPGRPTRLKSSCPAPNPPPPPAPGGSKELFKLGGRK